jgi:hypothetical protein
MSSNVRFYVIACYSRGLARARVPLAVPLAVTRPRGPGRGGVALNDRCRGRSACIVGGELRSITYLGILNGTR